MHADEARQISERKIAGNLEKVFAAIKVAAENEDLSLTVGRDIFGKYPDDIVKELQSKSYKAEYHSDQRDGDYIQISW
jgi:hypothetical protein